MFTWEDFFVMEKNIATDNCSEIFPILPSFFKPCKHVKSISHSGQNLIWSWGTDHIPSCSLQEIKNIWMSESRVFHYTELERKTFPTQRETQIFKMQDEIRKTLVIYRQELVSTTVDQPHLILKTKEKKCSLELESHEYGIWVKQLIRGRGVNLPPYAGTTAHWLQLIVVGFFLLSERIALAQMLWHRSGNTKGILCRGKGEKKRHHKTTLLIKLCLPLLTSSIWKANANRKHR